LWVYPTSFEALIRLAPDGSLRLPTLKIIFSSSEVLTAEVSQQARSIFGVPMVDYYGQAERVCASFGNGTGEHFFLPAYGHVELVYSHTDDDHDLYEIVGTPYWNLAQPLVKYRTEDYARLPKGCSRETLDAVCHGLLPFQGVAGRQSDYLISPEGARLMGIDHVPRGVPDVVQMQFVQTTAHEVEIHVVAKPNYSGTTERLIMEQARRKIPSSMTIDIRRVDSVQRTARAKAPLVIRNIEG
jgi:phenylacetate-CoA ligase